MFVIYNINTREYIYSTLSLEVAQKKGRELLNAGFNVCIDYFTIF